jgi:hypothetical protein
LHQRQKPGLLRLLQPENLDASLRNSVFQALLRMVQDVSINRLGCKTGKHLRFEVKDDKVSLSITPSSWDVLMSG